MGFYTLHFYREGALPARYPFLPPLLFSALRASSAYESEDDRSDDIAAIILTLIGEKPSPAAWRENGKAVGGKYSLL